MRLNTHRFRLRTPFGGSRRSGYTLTELMLAMSLFSMLGVGLVALLSRASDFLTVGSSSAETLDALQTFSESFQSDVSTLYTAPDSEVGTPDVRLYSDYVVSDVDGDEEGDARIQRLFFTRLIPREATAYATRNAGSSADATAYMDQRGDLEELEAGQLQATGGLMEVFWTAVPTDPDDLAVMTLYRGYRSPIGGEDSLFPQSDAGHASTLLEEKGPVHREQIAAVARPVMTGVLHFGVDFWSRKTKSWDSSLNAKLGGALATWDSTRGIMSPLSNAQARDDGFYFAKGLDSAEDPTDDTYPRRMRVTLVVESQGVAGQTGYLAGELASAAKFVTLEDAAFIPAIDTASRFIKIGSEWIQFTDFDGTTLTGCTRGARGTIAQDHQPGSIVHHGRTVVREFTISSFRDTYQDELPQKMGRVR